MKSFSHATSAKIFSELKNIPFRPGRPLRESSAFSLTEVVIAMGVATVAFTSIIALFPLGLNMSKESFESVQASLLAQTILADLSDTQSGDGNQRTPSDPFYQRLIQIGPGTDPQNDSGETNYKTLPLSITSPVFAFVAYKQTIQTNSTTDPARALQIRPCNFSTNSNPPLWYTSGSNGLFAVAKITISPTFRITTVNSTTAPTRIDIAVETPGTANISNRTCYLFTGVARP